MIARPSMHADAPVPHVQELGGQLPRGAYIVDAD